MLFHPKTINTNSKQNVRTAATTTSMILNNILQISLLEHHIISTIFRTHGTRNRTMVLLTAYYIQQHTSNYVLPALMLRIL